MMSMGKEALEEEKSFLAAGIFELDNRVDEINRAATEIIAKYIQDNPDRALECLNLISIIRKMERIGDHCNNMAEEIIFYLDAKILKHADSRIKNKIFLLYYFSGINTHLIFIPDIFIFSNILRNERIKNI